MSGKPLSILLLGTQMEMGGAQKVLLSQARWLHARGHTVEAVFLYDKQGLQAGWEAEHAFPIIELAGWKSPGFFPLNLLRLLGGMLRLWRLLRDVEVIESFTTHSNLIGLPLARLAGVPVRLASLHGILASRGDWIARLHGRLANSSAVSVLVCVSEQVRRYAIQRESVRPEKIEVIENGIEIREDQQPAPAVRAAIRQALDLPDGAILLLAVGRLIPAKGHAVLLNALPELVAHHPGLVCAIAGEGPLMEQLQSQAAKLGIIHAMRFLGTRQDVDDLLAAADVYVQPSLSEGLSIAMLEAMATKVPVVASDVGAAGDLIEDGRSGLLVPTEDTVALAAALRRVLDDAGLRDRLVRAAHQRVADHYNVDAMCRAYEDLMVAQLERQSV